MLDVPEYVCVLGVDPGTTTGLAMAMFDVRGIGAHPSAIWSDQLAWEEATEEISNRLEMMRTMRESKNILTFVAAEKFMINARTAQRGQSPAEDATGMLGVVRYISRLTNIQVVYEQASSAKSLVKDGTLRQLKMYAPGLTHCNDAFRHVILLAVKRHYIDTKMLLPESERK